MKNVFPQKYHPYFLGSRHDHTMLPIWMTLSEGRDLANIWVVPPYCIKNAAIVAVNLHELSACLHGLELTGFHSDMPIAAVRSRQLSFLAGRLCAERAVMLAADVPGRVGRNPVGVPIWPSGLTGAITHHHELALAVAGVGGYGLGVDSEKFANAEQLQAILAMCCTKRDRNFIYEANHTERATLLFSAKEAAFKAIFPLLGRFADFAEFEVTAHDQIGRCLLLEPVNVYDWPVPLPDLQVSYLVQSDMVHCWLDVRS